MSAENIEKFISALETSLNEKTFVKVALSNYRGTDPHLQKLMIRMVETTKGIKLFFRYRYNTRDIIKNHSFEEGTGIIRNLLGNEFFNGHLFTTKNDFHLSTGKKGNGRLNKAKPTFKTVPSAAHDRKKERIVDPKSFYLKALDITNDDGEVRDKQHDKWKQINKFVEILANLYDNSELKGGKELTIVDMGSGKGYLTFATYDFFKNVRGLDVTVTGVDMKEHVIELCNELAKSCAFDGLNFVNASIESYELQNADILIALHACDTATDDAIFKGIAANAELIITAPCCHREVRPQIKAPEMMSGILRHGIMLERTAETITDGLRALLLEKSGYDTKLFEFIATEHTPKNNMIVGTRKLDKKDTEKFGKQIDEIKEFYGIGEQRLETLLENS
ncbi:MAG TPA: SAM-dependent methyltransferase [Pyrinomonadaceae bacterium]|jgi:SAM-dependent methyltransferase|nr:SAM-dependent methyltransferase [Pyrinomonadaceae bacterium]